MFWFPIGKERWLVKRWRRWIGGGRENKEKERRTNRKGERRKSQAIKWMEGNYLGGVSKLRFDFKIIMKMYIKYLGTS